MNPLMLPLTIPPMNPLKHSHMKVQVSGSVKVPVSGPLNGICSRRP